MFCFIYVFFNKSFQNELSIFKIRGFQTLNSRFLVFVKLQDLATVVLLLGMAACLQPATVPLGSASMLDSCSVATSWVLKSPDQVISKGPGSSMVTADLANTRVLDLRLGAHSSRSRGKNNEVTWHARIAAILPREQGSKISQCNLLQHLSSRKLDAASRIRAGLLCRTN